MLCFFVGKTSSLVKQQEKPMAFFDFSDTLFCKMKSQNLKKVIGISTKVNFSLFQSLNPAILSDLDL